MKLRSHRSSVRLLANLYRAGALVALPLLAATACSSAPGESSAGSAEAVDTLSWRAVDYADFPGQLAVAQDPDGRLELFALTRDGQLLRSVQASPGGAFGKFVDMNAHSLRMFSVLPNADGRLEVFALGGDRALYHVWQSSPGGAWNTNWASLAGQNLQQIDAARNQDGRIEVFALGGDGVIYHIWQTGPNANFGPWQYLGGTKIAQVSVAADADGSLDVLALGSDHNPYRIRQVQPNGGFGNWSFVGSAQYHFNTLRLGRNADGHLELFGLTDASQVVHAWQVAPNAWFSDFAAYPALPNSAHAVNLTTTNEADGRMSVFAMGNGNDSVYQIEQAVVNGGWQGAWQNIGLGGGWSIAAARNADGREQVFEAYSGGYVYSLAESAPNGPWETHYVAPSVQFASWDAPRAAWAGTQIQVSWSLAAYNGCNVKAHIRMTEGAKILKDQDIGTSGSITVTPQDVGHVQTVAWASCAGANGTTVTRSQDTEMDTAYNGGWPTCSGGAAAQAYTFCLSAPNQTNPPQCWYQSTTTVLACDEGDAKKAAQNMATNWSIQDGACPGNCQ